MIKLQDFAKQQGVTDRAIQKHLKTYAEELEGLYQRKGPNGTWLTDEACEILRSKMKQAPITLVTPSEREEELQTKIQNLERELYETQKEYTAYVRHATPLLEKASEQLALAERAEEYKEQVKALRAEKDEVVQKASQELLDARKQFEDEKHLMQQEIEQLRNRKWWQLLFKKGGTL